MRRILITALVGSIAALGFAAVSAGAASASPTCFAGGHTAGPVTVNGAVSGTGGYFQVCVEGAPVGGTVTLAGDAVSRSGYIVADGNDANPGASSGYVGVSSAENGIVACSNGDFNNEAYSPPIPASGDQNEGLGEGTATDNDTNNQFLPLPTDPNFQTDLQNDLAALAANSGPCAVTP